MMSVKSQAEAIAASDYTYDATDEKNPPRLEAIVWEDHYSLNGWGTVDEKISLGQREYIVTSVGYRLFEDQKKVILTHTLSHVAGSAAETMVILKSTIRSRTTLTKKRNK